MHGSILYSATRALVVAFCVVIGLCLGFMFVSFLLGAFNGNSPESKLTTVNTEEILPNAQGQRTVLDQSAPVILQIEINGIIGTEGLDESSIRQQLVESREGTFKHDRVKALLLYINTPGGTVTGADGIFRALKEYKHKYEVPIYAYVDGLCASGGMYVALAADKVFASDTSLIGSIGVIAPSFINVTQLLDKLGVETMTLSAGKGKDAMNPLSPWKPGEENNYRDIIDYYYRHFVDLVTTYRPQVDKELLIQEYGAHIFPAPLAAERGFIDKSGISLEDTLNELLKSAGISDDHYQVIRLEDKGWWKSLFSSQANSLFKGRIEHRLSFSEETDLLFRNQYLYLYRP